MNRLKLIFYIFLGVLGFLLLLVDTTSGSIYLGHLVFFKQNVDAIEGVLLIFISAYNIGKITCQK